jgi:hypothetical protein
MLNWYLQLPLIDQLLWGVNILVIVEAVYQAWPLWVVGVPVPSRRSYVVAMIKYGLGAGINTWFQVWPIAVWLGIGLIKEFVCWVKVVELKDGMNDTEFCDYFDD